MFPCKSWRPNSSPSSGDTDGLQLIATGWSPRFSDNFSTGFVSKDKFRELISQGAFIEHAQFSDNFYGTSFMTVQEIQKSGRRCLLDIEAQVRSI